MVNERLARSDLDSDLSQLSGNLEKKFSTGDLFCFLDWCNESIPGLANARPVLAASNQHCAQVNGIRGNLFAQFVLSAHKGAFFLFNQTESGLLYLFRSRYLCCCGCSRAKQMDKSRGVWKTFGRVLVTCQWVSLTRKKYQGDQEFYFLLIQLVRKHDQ